MFDKHEFREPPDPKRAQKHEKKVEKYWLHIFVFFFLFCEDSSQHFPIIGFL